jgi:hypothetical protein
MKTPIGKADREKILTCLRTDSTLQKVNFQHGEVTYGPLHYVKVAERIEGKGKKRIKVFMVDADLGGGYIFELNEMLIKPLDSDGWKYWYSKIVHEATHAIQDINATSMTLLEAETAAFTAQGLYLDAAGWKMGDSWVAGGQTTVLIQAAMAHGAALRGGKGNTETLATLRKRIKAHSAYASNIAKVLKFNG